MELVALKKLSNGIKPGQTFLEKHRATADLLIAIGAAQPVTDGMFACDAQSTIVVRPRRRRARRTDATESASA